MNEFEGEDKALFDMGIVLPKVTWKEPGTKEWGPEHAVVIELRGEHTCNHRWKASRPEVQTTAVEHVCLLPKYHMDWNDGVGELLEPPVQVEHRDRVHICSCGAHT